MTTPQKYTVELLNKGPTSATLVARVAVDDKKGGAEAAVKFAQSATLRQDVYDNRHEHGLGDFGMSNGGAPHVETKEVDGQRIPVAYVRDFRFTRRVG